MESIAYQSIWTPPFSATNVKAPGLQAP
jgi:hypothetical protein